MRSSFLVVCCLFACVRANPSPPKQTPSAKTQPTSAPVQGSASAPTSTAAITPTTPTEPPTPAKIPTPPKPTSEEIAAGQVQGVLYTTRSYCGGARPPDGLLNELRTPKPSPETTLLFRRGATNSTSAKVAAEVKTDKDGNFSASKLSAGDYCVVSDAKRKYELPKWGGLVADKKCYANWLKECDSTVTVGKTHGEYLEVTIFLGCGDPVCVPIPPRP